MHRTIALAVVLMGLSSAARATELSAGVGAFQEDTKNRSLYLLELKQDKRSLQDFEVRGLAHSTDTDTAYDGAQFLYQGFGFDFDPIRINLEAGYAWSLEKFVLDEVDYGISHSVVGGRVTFNFPFLLLFAGARSYRPTWSPKTTIDSFDLTFNPSPYRWLRAGVELTIKSIQLQAEAGRFQNLEGRFDVLADSYAVKLDPVTYQKAALQLSGQQKTHIRVEWHHFIEDNDDRLLFAKLTGSSLNRDAFNGGLIALGIEF